MRTQILDSSAAEDVADVPVFVVRARVFVRERGSVLSCHVMLSVTDRESEQSTKLTLNRD